MNIFIIFAFVCLAVTVAIPASDTGEISPRSQRNGYAKSARCQSGSCPPWKCQDDSAVIHGYCCHCPGWEYDNVPVPCYPDLICPASPEPLCSDYNFMMDCCCTGP